VSGFPESPLSGSSVTFCHASFGPCQLAPWHGITKTMFAPQGPPAYTFSHTHKQTLSIMPSHSFSSPPPPPTSITRHLKPHAVIQQHCFIYLSLLLLSQAVHLSITLCRSAGCRRRVTPGLQCRLRGRATGVVVITARCLGRAGLVGVGTDWVGG